MVDYPCFPCLWGGGGNGIVGYALGFAEAFHDVGLHYIAPVGKGGEHYRHLEGGGKQLALTVAAFRKEHEAELCALVVQLGGGNVKVKGHIVAEAYAGHVALIIVPAQQQRCVGKVDIVGMDYGAAHIQGGHAAVFHFGTLYLAAHPCAKFGGKPVIILNFPFKYIVFIQRGGLEGSHSGKGLQNRAGGIQTLSKAIVKGGIRHGEEYIVIGGAYAPGKGIKVVPGP